MTIMLTKIGKEQDIEWIVTLPERNDIQSWAESLLLFGIIFRRGIFGIIFNFSNFVIIIFCREIMDLGITLNVVTFSLLIFGTIFCGVRLVLTALDVKSKKWESFKFLKDYHFGFEAAAWYWHFVDVVWIFLYLIIYWWSEIPNVELNIVQTMEVACENKKC
jgi:heme/copper-type cytochrome/quinol oxidase subunit 3